MNNKYLYIFICICMSLYCMNVDIIVYYIYKCNEAVMVLLKRLVQ